MNPDYVKFAVNPLLPISTTHIKKIVALKSVKMNAGKGIWPGITRSGRKGIRITGGNIGKKNLKTIVNFQRLWL